MLDQINEGYIRLVQERKRMTYTKQSLKVHSKSGVNQSNSELNQNKMGLKLLLYDKN